MEKEVLKVTKKEVVVVDKKNQRLIPGILMPGDGRILGAEEDVPELKTKNIKAVIKNATRFTTAEFQNAMQEYPDIIIADESLIFDVDEFYSGAVPPERYIDPKYKVGDYVVGIANPECKRYSGGTVETTLRLVGGIVSDINIIEQIGDDRYSYNIEYTIKVDVKYSIEQLRRDGMRQNKYYAVEDCDSLDRIYTTVVNEKDTIHLIADDYDDNEIQDKLRTDGLHNSEGYTLFYTMGVMLMKAQTCMFNSRSISKIANALLKISWNIISPNDSRPTNLGKYEGPLKLILDEILATIAMMLNPNINTKIVQILNIPEISALFTHGDIICGDTCIIPWESIAASSAIRCLTDPYISGIDQDAFTDMIVNFINMKFNDPDSIKARGNLPMFAEQLYSCIKSPITVGCFVKLDPNNLKFDEGWTPKPVRDKVSSLALKEEPFTVAGIRNNTIVELTFEDAPSKKAYVYISSCIYYSTDLENADRYIFSYKH